MASISATMSSSVGGCFGVGRVKGRSVGWGEGQPASIRVTVPEPGKGAYLGWIVNGCSFS